MKYAIHKDLNKQIKKNPALKTPVDSLCEKIATMDEQQLRANFGTHLEPIVSKPGFSTIRAGKGPRIVCQVVDGGLLLLSFESHTGAYKKGMFDFTATFLLAP